MTRVVRFHRHGGPEVLCIETVDVPPPAKGEVQIRVRALGLNRAEALLRTGSYIETATFPSGLGLEAAGIVEAIGEGVAGFAPGDAVSIVPPLSMVRWPAYAELATFPAELVVKHPPELGFEAAAAVWMQYLTAYGALVDIAGLGRGDVVAITAASSSVGLAAIQIANRIGAVPVALTRTSTKRRALRDAGAAHVIASDEEDIGARLTEIAGPDGVRVVFDAGFSRNETEWHESTRHHRLERLGQDHASHPAHSASRESRAAHCHAEACPSRLRRRPARQGLLRASQSRCERSDRVLRPTLGADA